MEQDPTVWGQEQAGSLAGAENWATRKNWKSLEKALVNVEKQMDAAKGTENASGKENNS